MNGQLREQPLAELIDEIIRHKLSGALRLMREPARTVVYTEAGAVMFCASNLRANRLTESLARWKTFDERTLKRVLPASTTQMSDAEVFEAIRAARLLSDDELNELRVRQATEALLPSLLWTDGEWNFDRQARFAETGCGAIESRHLLLESARRLPNDTIASNLTDETERIAPVSTQTEIQTATQTDAINTLTQELQPTEAFVLSRIDMSLTLGEVFAVSGLPEEMTRRIVYALWLGGCVERGAPPAHITSQTGAASVGAPKVFGSQKSAANGTPSKVGASKPSPPSQAANTARATETPLEATPQQELEALFARVYRRNHYEIIGVEQTASSQQIKVAYYALAKRFHPDRFHGVTDEAARGQVESAFAQIARAYEILKEEKTRRSYDLALQAHQARRTPTTATTSNAAPNGDARSSQNASSFAEANQPSTRHASNAPAATISQPTPSARSNVASTPTASRATSATTTETIAGTVADTPATHFAKGEAALAANNQSSAAYHLGEAARTSPQEAKYRAAYGRALAREPRTRHQAETELQAAIRLDAHTADYRVWLAELYLALGMARRAEAELQRALVIDSRHTAARHALDKLKAAN